MQRYHMPWMGFESRQWWETASCVSGNALDHTAIGAAPPCMWDDERWVMRVEKGISLILPASMAWTSIKWYKHSQGSKLSFFPASPTASSKATLKVVCIENSTSLGSLQENSREPWAPSTPWFLAALILHVDASLLLPSFYS